MFVTEYLAQADRLHPADGVISYAQDGFHSNASKEVGQAYSPQNAFIFTKDDRYV